MQLLHFCYHELVLYMSLQANISVLLEEKWFQTFQEHSSVRISLDENKNQNVRHE